MAAIEPDLGPFRRDIANAPFDDILQAGGPVDLRQAALDGFEAQIRLDAAQGRDGGRCILKLVAPGQPRQRQIEKSARVLENEAAMLFAGGKIAHRVDRRRARSRGLKSQHLMRVVVLDAEDRRNAGLENAGLLISDLRDRRP